MNADLIQILGSLPLPLLVLASVGVPVVGALALGHLIQSLFTPRELAQHAVVGATKFGFIVEIYAVVAALTLVGSWDIYQTARDNLQRETGALYLLALSVPSYADPAQASQRTEMFASIRAYAGAVATLDWQHMQAASNRTGSEVEFHRLTRAFLDAEPANAAQQALAQNVVGWIAQVSDARIARLSANSRTFGALVWFLVLTVSVAVLAFQWFIGSSTTFVHYAMGAVIAVIIGTVLAVSARLAFPFAGVPPLLSPVPFHQLTAVGT